MSNDTRLTLEDLEIQRFFFAPSFEVYNGVAGLYDLGPVGCAIERNLLAKWRDHFVIEEDMCEVRCSMLTPYKVLESSGHTAKFSDFMVSDSVTKQLYRADQLIEQELEKRIEKCKDPQLRAQMEHDHAQAGDLQADGIQALIEKWDIKSPEKNPLTQPVPFNLMFNTMIGPGERAIPGFLRPETAQGIFVNFPRLYEFQKQLPFACAQQGVAYRNEIAPRNGLVRCREFMMAEIEHFADPDKLNDFPKFDNVKDLEIAFLSAERQESSDEAVEAVKMTIGKAVEDGVVCHKTMGYYIGRTYLFMVSVGIDPERLRFRQHRSNEKAHYARDCWDAEIKVSIGWLECAGIADRQSFDLTQHSKATAKSGESMNQSMMVQVRLDQPIKKEVVTLTPNKAAIGKNFKTQAKQIMTEMEALDEATADQILAKYNEAEAMIGGTPKKGQEQAAVEKLNPDDRAKFEELTTLKFAGQDIKYGMYSIAKKQVTVNNRSFVPNVIEPSFGVGRIITCLLEHAFYIRKDGERRVLGLKPCIAPYKVVVLPIGAKLVPESLVHDVRVALRRAGIAHRADSSGVSIGKRYARTDELGISFAITLDQKTVENGTVTLRERDSTSQIRLTIPEAVAAVVAITNGTETWETLSPKYEAVQVTEAE